MEENKIARRPIISEKYNLQYVSFIAWIAFIISFFMPFVTIELFIIVKSFSAINSLWSWIHIILITLLVPYARGTYPFKRLAVLDDIWESRGINHFFDKFIYSIAGAVLTLIALNFYKFSYKTIAGTTIYEEGFWIYTMASLVILLCAFFTRYEKERGYKQEA